VSLLRVGMLFLAAWAALVAAAAWAPDLAPSGVRLVVVSVVALAAPLLWPGLAVAPKSTLLRVGLWSFAAAVATAAVLWIFGGPRQPLLPVLLSAAFLLGLLLPAHAAAALLESRWRGLNLQDESSREMAGSSVALALALLGTLPLWLGPVAELLRGGHEGIIDTLIGASPLTHLAVASGNDLLRNEWLYQHSNLAALPFSYPGLAGLAGFYSATFTLLLVAALAWQRRFGKPSYKEKTP
jgi:hypothetical protein